LPDHLHFRPAGPQDRAALFSICLLTAASGEDATGRYSDPDYPGLVWAVPYLDFAPRHCFVVDEGGTAIGFVVGTPDTLSFERRLEAGWWPGLRRHYAGRAPRAELDSRVLDYIRAPEASDPAIVARYPAHLHINLLAPARSGGWGRKLIEAELESLRDAGASGVHLGVSDINHRAIGFYRHVGFTELSRSPGAVWFGRQL
jgi:ribosomal protein S18 acetylase RimI-like enzyme